MILKKFFLIAFIFQIIQSMDMPERYYGLSFDYYTNIKRKIKGDNIIFVTPRGFWVNYNQKTDEISGYVRVSVNSSKFFPIFCFRANEIIRPATDEEKRQFFRRLSITYRSGFNND